MMPIRFGLLAASAAFAQCGGTLSPGFPIASEPDNQGATDSDAGQTMDAARSAVDLAERRDARPEVAGDGSLRPVDRPPVLPASGPMAFPGAEGFGADTAGGRGGRIIEVTNLNDTGAGSFRAAVQATGPRIVVFRVSGTITMASDIVIPYDPGSYLTVAGQTSPGGIQLKGPAHGISIIDGAHDIVIRHLRIRPGQTQDGMSDGEAGIMLAGDVSNIVIDHVSLAWTLHKEIVLYHAAAKVTFQWNLIGEASGYTADAAGNYVKGGIYQPTAGVVIGYNDPDEVAFHHNLVAHSTYALAAYGAKAIDIRNNVFYNYEGEVGFLGSAGTYVGTVRANLVGNYLRPGPLSDKSRIYDLGNYQGGTRLFTEGNWGPQCPTGCANDWSNGFGEFDVGGLASESKYRAPAAFSVPPVATQPAGDVKDAVLFYAGAQPRDSLDTRIVDDVVTGRGRPALDKVGRGPWPVLDGPAPPPDRDHDGMSDAWETAHRLDPDDPADGKAVTRNGYTNVENYLNELAGDPVP